MRVFLALGMPLPLRELLRHSALDGRHVEIRKYFHRRHHLFLKKGAAPLLQGHCQYMQNLYHASVSLQVPPEE